MAKQPADIWTPSLRWPPMSDDELAWWDEYEEADDVLSPKGDAELDRPRREGGDR